MLLMGGGGGIQRRASGLDLGGGRTVYTGRATEQALRGKRHRRVQGVVTSLGNI